jgi:hypothetical protein
MEQNYEDMVKRFLLERDASIAWLQGLKNPNWDYGYIHPKLGKVTAKHYIDNWLAHDYLHVRQIIKQKFDFLSSQTNENLEYAGIW